MFERGPNSGAGDFCKGSPPLYLGTLRVYRFTIDIDQLQITNDGQLVMEFKPLWCALSAPYRQATPIGAKGFGVAI